MSTAGIVLLDVASVAARFPGRWWVPPAEMLAAVAPDRAYVKVLALERDADGRGGRLGRAADLARGGGVRPRRVVGPIVDSELERAGYRDGERIVVPWGRIFDLVLLDADGEAIFNEQRALFAIGKRVLVGISVLALRTS